MHGRTLLIAALAASLVALAAPAEAGLLSKTYEFKAGVTLEVGVQTEEGLRIDTVRLELPTTSGGKTMRTAGEVRAEVSISNVSGKSQKVGIAMALFDDQGRLVGVASGGTKLLPVKANRQRLYDLVFQYVNAEAYRARTFQISIEPKP